MKPRTRYLGHVSRPDDPNNIPGMTLKEQGLGENWKNRQKKVENACIVNVKPEGRDAEGKQLGK